ncbi:CidA/LrgA family protein [Anaerotalea alkaliphila]|uniref:CidA/LrgA family protein n=1 Tax=Anaerotalea alkaliphila TaxID=2662126 RepID=A0A7X5HVD0_9FIRM|nr:CidA/LrgA family protein [Anaerotalea alkaliphila]NDL67320.1 CidA/LrgA family protein [Anaerotalea alkaliphila]
MTKTFKEAAWILGVFLVGQMGATLLRPLFPVPGAMLGMGLLFLLFLTKKVEPAQVEGVGNFLVGNMAFFFVPLAAGIMTQGELLGRYWWQLLVMVGASTLLVMGTTALAVQFLVRHQAGKGAKG